jgi:V/A-type H+-transporting ATPase subunit E
MKQQDLDTLTQAITREAERDRQRILGDGQARAEAIRAQMQVQVAEETAQLVQAAEAKAARAKQETLGAAGLEAQALKVRMRESLLEQVFGRASGAFQTPTQWQDYAAILESLVTEAVEHLGGGKLVVRADEDTLTVLDQALLDRISQATHSELSLGSILLEATGVVVESPDGHVRYDNTLQTRLGRMRAALRAPVYRVLVGDEP